MKKCSEMWCACGKCDSTTDTITHLPNNNKMKNIKLFFAGFLQVYFISINTYLISNKNLIGVLIVGFTISMLWSYNVQKVSFGTLKDRLIYAFGASVGGVLGLKLSILIF